MTAIWHTLHNDGCVPVYARTFSAVAIYDLDYETGNDPQEARRFDRA